MNTVALFESQDGHLFLHQEGDSVLWALDPRTASTFLTDAMVMLNGDTLSHSHIFGTPMKWSEAKVSGWNEEILSEKTLRLAATLTVSPTMTDQAAAYILYLRPWGLPES